ncbi:hypothetical protein H257_10934 [Aphanomyces astaci]|uniref:Calmodulin-lysine N-methyltransferase n=1 Tax=Aphanomyces astaci TaxID=112090 RepID=W4G5Y0_APHAT|nr:hypothetical protein H257_10934 [Aphanomyces astaci]ETV74343.1 hypothetical protein H257_10934 [Aphanomyces astaci]RQM31273.1 hypothetical protein B5M09_012760 [Aphanomyces astaci]|eukprot:XP_009836001.1 hypothetical protein H257_10934 [Aphanomyces astaci]
MTDNTVRQAKTRWARLRSAIRKHVENSTTDPHPPSAMSMFSFYPVASTLLSDRPPFHRDYEWRRYPLPRPPHHLSLHARKEQCTISVHELAVQSVDNTGNIRTWPCEDLLWRVLIDKFPDTAPPRRVLELGAGMCGVAGLALACQLPATSISHVVVTDGNASCVENLRLNVEANIAQGHLRAHSVTAELLAWSRAMLPVAADPFDVVIASDCLFFESFHVDLVHTLCQVTRPRTGVIYLLQPSRGGSLERFVALAQEHFTVVVDIDFDAAVMAQHAHFLHDPQYIPSLHQPILVTLTWPSPL